MGDWDDPTGWWVMKPCRHWDKERNLRFRFIRIDGPTDHCGIYPATILDGQTGELRRQPYGVRGGELARRATPKELQVAMPLGEPA